MQMRTQVSALLIAAAATTAAAQPAPAAGDPAPPPAEPALALDPAPAVVVEAPPAAQPAAGFDKGFFIRNDDGTYSLLITGRVQPFYTWTKQGDDYHNAMEVRRARLTLEGTLHTKRLRYKMQSDFGKGNVTLKDYYFDVAPVEDVWLRVGQWKRPFSRQQITSSGRLETTDRAITDKTFGAGRDIGIALHNNYEKSPGLEWAIGVFNGTGDGARFVPTLDEDGAITGGAFTNVPLEFRPAVVGRIGLNRNGIKGYTEADLEGGPLRWGAAASVWLEGDFDHNNTSSQKAELDYVVKAQGLSTTGGVYAMTAQDGEDVTDQTASFVGFHVQAGYMLTEHWQASARYALVDARLEGVDGQQEISVGGNFFAFGHDAKFAGGVRFTKNGDAGFDDLVQVELGANVGF